MPDNDPAQRVAVHVGECRCAGTPHAPDGDVVYLASEASMTMGLRSNGAVAKADGDEALLELYLGRVFIEEGITDWTFVDESGDSIPVNPTNIERLLPWGNGGADLAEKANDLYGKTILAPLVKRSLNTSGLGPTNGSTSHTRPSRSTRRSSSKSSSRASSGIPR